MNKNNISVANYSTITGQGSTIISGTEWNEVQKTAEEFDCQIDTRRCPEDNQEAENNNNVSDSKTKNPLLVDSPLTTHYVSKELGSANTSDKLQAPDFMSLLSKKSK